jgi:hypothetical protein
MDAVLLVEGDSGHLVEADDVVLADQPALPGRHVHEHLGDRRLAARQQVRVGRDLLVDVALPGAARPQLHQVVVPLHEGHHPEQHDPLRALVERVRLQADRADQEVAPFGGREGPAPPGENVEDVGIGHLDRPQRSDPERPPLLLLRDERVVLERHLGVESVREHPFVRLDGGVLDLHVVQVQAGELRDVAVVPRVEPRSHDVDQLDGTVLPSPRLKDLLFGRPNRAPLQLLLDDGQSFLDLGLVDARAVAPEQELHDVGRHRILSRVPPHEILADQISGKRVRCHAVQMIHLNGAVRHESTPTRVRW